MWKVPSIAVAAALVGAVATHALFAQTPVAADHSGHGPGSSPAQSGHAYHSVASGQTPMAPGQDAFGAIAEVVAILDADPATGWSRVDLERLRRHLIDMNEVVLRAAVAA